MIYMFGIVIDVRLLGILKLVLLKGMVGNMGI